METQQMENGVDRADGVGSRRPIPAASPRPRGTTPPRPGLGARPETFPFTTETVTLHHPPVVGTFDFSYDSYRRAFYHVTSVLQQLHVDQGVELVHAFLDGLLNDSAEGLRQAKSELIHLIQARTGSKAYPVQTPQAQTREAKVPSYVVRRYLELLVQVDDFISCVIYAESRGAIKWDQRRRLIAGAPRHALVVHDRFMTLARRVQMQELSAADDAMDAVRRIVSRLNGPDPDESAADAAAATAENAPAAAEPPPTAEPVATPRAPRRAKKGAEVAAEASGVPAASEPPTESE